MALAGAVWTTALLLAVTAPLPAAQINRDVIALYDGSTEPYPHSTMIHQVVEMPLNHLGLRVTYVDMREPLPDAATAGGYRAILLWLKSGTKPSQRAFQWLSDAADAGVRVLIMGEIAELAAASAGVLDRLLARLGLRYEGYDVDATFRARVGQADSLVVGAERQLDPPLPPFPVVTRQAARSTAHLTLTQSGRAGPAESVLVATGRAGGFIAANYALAYDARADRLQWLIEPFGFFRRALLADESFPIPDVTTISGRRIYFSHIDGDGWNNVSRVEQYREKHSPSALVALRELIEPYPGLPVTVGFVAGDGDPDHGGQPLARSIAREIFSLPQVEVGSHTYTHPYDWSFFENYDQMRGQRVSSPGIYGKAGRPANPARPLLGLTMPRARTRQPFDLRLEVDGALRAVDQLAPPGKRATLYQWSGDARPFESAVKLTRLAGVRNLNGGDARLDSSYPSLAYLPPLARMVGQERQIYAVNSNDYTYGLEVGRPHAFLRLAETLGNTEQPIRLKGFNLYYHMYAAERSASLNAVRHFLKLADKGPYVPIAASRYAAIADSFFAAEIWEEGANRWSIRGRGDIETVRFDRAGDRRVDLSLSKGVLGARRHGDSLYVALDPAIDRPIVTLQESAANRAAAASTMAYLNESRWRLSHLEREPCRLSFRATGYGPGQMSWKGIEPGAYRIAARRASQPLWSTSAAVDAGGTLDFTVEAEALEPLVVDISCAVTGPT